MYITACSSVALCRTSRAKISSASLSHYRSSSISSVCNPVSSSSVHPSPLAKQSRSFSFSSALRHVRSSVPRWSHGVDWKSPASLTTQIKTAAPVVDRFQRRIATMVICSHPRGSLGSSRTKKDISTVEDPFDAPTYNIPEKPVTFTEGASYSLIILAGLGVAAATAYAVFKELIFQPKEYKFFGKALERIQTDSQMICSCAFLYALRRLKLISFTAGESSTTFYFSNSALANTSVASTTVLASTSAFFTRFFEALLGQGSINTVKIIAVCISMTGVKMTTLGKTWAMY